MTTNPGIPQQISEIMYQATGQLLESIRLVKETCPAEDAVAYSKGARQVLSQIGKILSLISSMDPIESPQPEKPLRRSPVVTNLATAQHVSETVLQVSRRLTDSLDLKMQRKGKLGWDLEGSSPRSSNGMRYNECVRGNRWAWWRAAWK